MARTSHLDREAPNREVGSVHPKAMPVILTRPEDWRRWLTAPTAEALQMQRPLPDGELEIVAEGGARRCDLNPAASHPREQAKRLLPSGDFH